jgi:hypothetical protein
MQIVEERQKSQWARLSPYLEDYFVDASGDGGAVDVAFLMNHIDFAFEYLAASGFFPSVLALLGPLLCELHSILCVLTHMAAPPHTQPCLIPSDDVLKLGISMLGFGGER